MNFEPTPSEEDMTFEPQFSTTASEHIASFLAEASIVRTIVQGSGGPENCETTETGLRFVRHILCTSKAIRFGFMPNLKDMNTIREVAREFIRKCGGTTSALQTMQSVVQQPAQ
ncbi:MAG TPA: hypothetical protein V6C97_23185 [Oculatellaceae cyanobacterium]|jgi:hypothetical protein